MDNPLNAITGTDANQTLAHALKDALAQVSKQPDPPTQPDQRPVLVQEPQRGLA